MNTIHWFLLSLAAAGLLLLAFDARRPRLALRYTRLIFLILIAVVFLAPFAWIVCGAFKDSAALFRYTFLPPLADWREHLSLDNFSRLFTPRPSLHGDIVFGQYLLNSLFLASAATVLQLLLCSLGGFALAKHAFAGRRHLMFFMLASMALPAQLFIAPIYDILVRIEWIDTYAALLVPGAANAFGIFLFRQSMLTVPDSLIEAARVDGAGDFRIYWGIVMPLLKPVTAAFSLIVFMASWTAFLGPQIFLQSSYKLTLPVILTEYITQYSENYGVFVAGLLLSILPIAALFIVLQREFIAGLTAGAVKG